MDHQKSQSGFTLLELLLAVAISAIIIVAIGGIAGKAISSWQYSHERQELLNQGNFAIARITTAVRSSKYLMLPLASNPTRDLLAVMLDPLTDRNNDGFADADNDKDGQIDEDIPADNTNDGVSGIIGIDDDGDGTIDEGLTRDNDEDISSGEDWLNGIDDDGDGAIDEDVPRKNTVFDAGAAPFDNDGDGQNGEDWYDPVVFRVNVAGTTLLERYPDINPVDGNDFTERIIAEAAQISMLAERLVPAANDRGILIEITITLSGKYSEPLQLSTILTLGIGN